MKRVQLKILNFPKTIPSTLSRTYSWNENIGRRPFFAKSPDVRKSHFTKSLLLLSRLMLMTLLTRNELVLKFFHNLKICRASNPFPWKIRKKNYWSLLCFICRSKKWFQNFWQFCTWRLILLTSWTAFNTDIASSVIPGQKSVSVLLLEVLTYSMGYQNLIVIAAQIRFLLLPCGLQSLVLQ